MFNVNEYALEFPTLQDRVRRLPEALLLTAGYYVSRVRVLNDLICRLD